LGFNHRNSLIHRSAAPKAGVSNTARRACLSKPQREEDGTVNLLSKITPAFGGNGLETASIDAAFYDSGKSLRSDCRSLRMMI